MNQNPTLSTSTSQSNLKVVSTETKANGESIQLVRPYTVSAKSTAEIVGDLVSNFSYRTMPVKASENELNAVQQAFGSSLASELIKTYDGSNLVSDSQQDLIGERYLAEQIKLIEQQQRDSSVLNKWSHLLYEGEKYDKYERSANLKKSSSNMLTTVTEVTTNPLTSTEQSAGEISQRSSYMPSQLLIEAQAQALDVEKSDESVLNDIITAVKSQQRNTDEQAENIEKALEKLKIEADMIAFEKLCAAEAEKEAEMEAEMEAAALAESEREAEAEQAASALQAKKERAKAQAEIRLEAAKAVVEEEERKSNISARYFQENREPSINKSSSQQKVNLKRSGSQHVQQPADYLPRLSNSNLNSVSLDAYNTPQFKTMLEQILKPMSVPAEETNYPADWPSPDKIAYLSEPIYIPAPLPIVIPAPNMLAAREFSELSEEITKPYVTHFPKSVPSIASDQANFKNFGIRQLNM